MFAKITPILGIFPESVNIQFLGFADNVADAILLAERLRLPQFPLRKRTGGRSNGDYLAAQSVMGCPQQKSGIHPAGKCHRNAAERLQIVL